jgi:hypothetical protein
MSLARIYLADKESGKWMPLTASPQDSDFVVQLAMANSPELIPGDQIDPENPRRWLLIESGIGGPDTATTQSLVLLDQTAMPTFVICEESAGAKDHNRSVASLISLATQATVTWSGKKMRQLAKETATEQDQSLEERLLLLLGGEPDEDAFWAAVDDNLSRRQMRLIFVSEVITNELWQMLQFLDGTMSAVQVLAMEMKQFQAAGQTALLPRIVGYGEPFSNTSDGSKSNGSTVAKSSPVWTQKPKINNPKDNPAQIQPDLKVKQATNGLKASKPLAEKRFSAENSGAWNEITFFRDLTSRNEEAQALVGSQIFNWAKKNTSRLEWGGDAARGAFAPISEQDSGNCQLFVVTSNGWVELSLHGYKKHPPFNKPEKLERFFEKLSAIDGLDLPAEALEKKALLPFSTFTSPARLAQFLKVFEWAIVTLESGSGEVKPVIKNVPSGKVSVLWPGTDELVDSKGNVDHLGTYESSFDELLSRKRDDLENRDPDESA